MAVTSEEAWNAYATAAERVDAPAAFLEAVRPFVESLPTVLADLLAHPVSWGNFLIARVRFREFCRDQGFIRAMIPFLPDQGVVVDEDEYGNPLTYGPDEFYDREITIDRLYLSRMSYLQPRMLIAYGSTDANMLEGPLIGFCEELMQRYRAGGLTIEDVVRIQPEVFF